MNASELVCNRKRRSLLKLAGLLGLGAAVTGLVPTEKLESLLFRRNQYKVSETRLAMGTYVAITAIHPSRDQAEQAMGEAFAEIDRLTRLLTRFDEGSSIGVLNTTGYLDEVPEPVAAVITASHHYYQRTGGVFDITVKPLLDLYQTRFAAHQEPTEQDMAAAVKLIGLESLEVRGKTLAFARPGMGVTLDGIAKGYIVDQASALLRARGIENHLINGGGDIRVSGHAAQGKPWSIAVQNPDPNGQYPETFTLHSGAVATSGDYEVYYDREKLFHHIVNARTGHSPHFWESSSIVAPTVTEADALSTAVFLMEPKDGVRLIDTMPGCACLLLAKDRPKTHSRAWSSLTGKNIG
nr:FAD:protein FMN transferase [uncultured Desulfobulbus sp.]